MRGPTDWITRPALTARATSANTVALPPGDSPPSSTSVNAPPCSTSSDARGGLPRRIPPSMRGASCCTPTTPLRSTRCGATAGGGRTNQRAPRSRGCQVGERRPSPTRMPGPLLLDAYVRYNHTLSKRAWQHRPRAQAIAHEPQPDVGTGGTQRGRDRRSRRAFAGCRGSRLAWPAFMWTYAQYTASRVPTAEGEGRAYVGPRTPDLTRRALRPPRSSVR